MNMDEMYESMHLLDDCGSEKPIPKTDNGRKTDTVRKPEAEWEAEKPTLHRLYVDGRLSLKQVIKVMAKDHDFFATPKQYRYQFQKWNWKKYNQPSRADPEVQGNLKKEAGAESCEDGSKNYSPNFECDPNQRKAFSRDLFKELINRLDLFPEDFQCQIRECFPTSMDLFKEIIDGADKLPKDFKCHARRYLYWFASVIKDTERRHGQDLSEVDRKAMDTSKDIDVIEIFKYFLKSLRAGQRGPFDPDSPYFIAKDGLNMGHVIMTFFVSALIAATAGKSGLSKVTSNFDIARQGVDKCHEQAWSDEGLDDEVVDAMRHIHRAPGFLEEISRAVDYECKLLLGNECGYQGNDQFTQIGYAQTGYFG